MSEVNDEKVFVISFTFLEPLTEVMRWVSMAYSARAFSRSGEALIPSRFVEENTGFAVVSAVRMEDANTVGIPAVPKLESHAVITVRLVPKFSVCLPFSQPTLLPHWSTGVVRSEGSERTVLFPTASVALGRDSKLVRPSGQTIRLPRGNRAEPLAEGRVSGKKRTTEAARPTRNS